MKSVIIAANAFLPTANPKHASFLGVTAGALVFPPAVTPGLSAYLNSKMAAIKALEFLAAENPNLFVASMHPGMVDTKIFRKSGAKPETLPMDSGEPPILLCSHRYYASIVITLLNPPLTSAGDMLCLLRDHMLTSPMA